MVSRARVCVACVLTKSDSECALSWPAGDTGEEGPSLAPLTPRDGLMVAQSWVEVRHLWPPTSCTPGRWGCNSSHRHLLCSVETCPPPAVSREKDLPSSSQSYFPALLNLKRPPKVLAYYGPSATPMERDLGGVTLLGDSEPSNGESSENPV